MNRVKVRIANRDYTLKTDEKAEYTKNLAQIIDKKINDLINESNGGMSVIDAAILTSLSAFDELTKINDNIDNLRTQIKGYVDEADKERQKCEELERELRAIKARSGDRNEKRKHNG